MGGIEAAARCGACEALGDLAVPSTTDIVSGVVPGLGKCRLNISKVIGEFSRTSLTSLREANASLKKELKAAHAEGDTKERRIVDLEATLAEATTFASTTPPPCTSNRIRVPCVELWSTLYPS